MPNTLIHIAVQSLAVRPMRAMETWFLLALLGCVIPDVPWIFQRLVSTLAPAVDRYDLRSYCTIQASLLYSCVLAGGLAAITYRPVLAWVILSYSCLLHLLLDASEIKWANGVHLLVPFDWLQRNWGIVWPEHWSIRILTVAALAIFAIFAIDARATSARLHLNPVRVMTLALSMMVYFLTPFLFIDKPYEADNHYLQTLRDKTERTGKSVEFDRVPVALEAGQMTLTTFTGESLRLSGSLSLEGTYSLKGRFEGPDRVLVSEWRRHDDFRDVASIVGLAMVLGWLLYVLWRVRARTRHSS